MQKRKKRQKRRQNVPKQPKASRPEIPSSHWPRSTHSRRDRYWDDHYRRFQDALRDSP